jgi:hypothetical protein
MLGLTSSEAVLLARTLHHAVSARMARLTLVTPRHEAQRLNREIADLEAILNRLDRGIVADLCPRLPA